MYGDCAITPVSPYGAEYHPGACYRNSSPYSDDSGTRDHTKGDMHYWEVWQGLKPLSAFIDERSRFFSEYGFQSFPAFESIKKYAPEPRDWEVASEVMMSHQRGGMNANNRINSFLHEEKISIPANTSALVWQKKIESLLNGLNRKEHIIHLEYKDKNKTVYENNFFFAKQKEINYPEIRIDKTAVPVKDGFELTLTSNAFARGVYISLNGKDDFISDNYMDLLPEKRITVKITTALDSAEFNENLTIVSFIDAIE
jgi:beta-galactosidase/beta-glucuronidase